MERLKEKERVWFANALMLRDWWEVRDAVSIVPSYSITQCVATLDVQVSNASDPDLTLDVLIPGWQGETPPNLRVELDGTPSSDYRVMGWGIKVKVNGASTVSLRKIMRNPG